jgi:hypothetical protein
MALVVKDRVKETTTVTGTGTATLLGAATGFQSFSAIGNANTTYYTISSNGGSEWEVGIGTYTSSGTTLSRDTVLASSNGGSLVSFSAGTKDVYVVYPAGKAVYQDASSVVNLPNNLTSTGTGNRITGDFSNATHVNRVAFQTSTTNGSTSPFLLPNGSSSTTQWVMSSAADPTNCSYMGVGLITGAEARVISGTIGSGTFLPMTFNTGGSERMRIVGGTGSDVGYVGIGTTSPAVPLDIYNATTASLRVQGDSTTNMQLARFSTDTTNPSFIIRKGRGTVASPTAVASGDIMGQFIFQAFGGTNNRNLAAINGAVETYTSDTDISSSLRFSTTPTGSVTGTERMRIDSSGNVGIGTSSPSDKLTVYGASSPAMRVQDATSYTQMYTTNGTGVLVNAGAGSFIFNNNGSERMRITSNGGVSFGSSGTAYGSSGQVLVSNGDTAPTWGSAIVSGTAQATTSGTFKYFTGIPSWVKRITVMFSGVSLSGTSYVMVQLGTSAGIVATGYLCYGGQTPTATGTAATTGMLMPFFGANVLRYGSMTLFSFSGNTWLSSFSVGGDSAGSGFGACGGGNVTLAGTLDRVRITTLNGTDTFDAGSINILYE